MSKHLTEREILAALSLRERSATYQILARTGPLPEPSRLRCTERLGRDLTACEALVYGYARRAVSLGFAAMWVSTAELAALCRFSTSSIRRALRALRALEVLERTRQYSGTENERRARLPNTWRLGPRAYRPRSAAPQRPAAAPPPVTVTRGGVTVTRGGVTVTGGSGHSDRGSGHSDCQSSHSDQGWGHSGCQSSHSDRVTTDPTGQVSSREPAPSGARPADSDTIRQIHLATPEDARAVAEILGGVR